MAGFIALHRRIRKHWIFQEPDFLKIWLTMLMDAKYVRCKEMVNGVLVTVERGQLVFGLDQWETTHKISKSKLRRLLKMLENDGMINRQKTNKYSLITIINYESYQSGDSQTASKAQANGTLEAPQTAAYKESKQGEEGKQGTSAIADPDDIRLAEYIFAGVKSAAPKTKEPDLNKWADTIRLMRERDGHNRREIAEVFRFANNDDFWRVNILSPAKLREKFAQLSAKKDQSHVRQPRKSQSEQALQQYLRERGVDNGDADHSGGHEVIDVN